MCGLVCVCIPSRIGLKQTNRCVFSTWFSGDSLGTGLGDTVGPLWAVCLDLPYLRFSSLFPDNERPEMKEGWGGLDVEWIAKKECRDKTGQVAHLERTCV